MTTFPLIGADAQILGGKPCIKGTRISVEFILELVASGATVQDIVKSYPHLTNEGVQQAILYASQFNRNEFLLEVKSVA